ncbi:phage integrase central domain-containing protein [Pseudomonas luteola]|uniref:phage integrase central domain-containing protein n=1 Tax=Pseudomonas luteola TaxID=47886 RepID=UPI0035E3CD7B
MLAREWYAYDKPRWAETTVTKAFQYLEGDILPVIGSQPVKDTSYRSSSDNL